MSMVISISERGTLTLPKAVRTKLGLAKAGQVLLDYDEVGQVILRPCATFPIEMYSEGRVAEFREAEAGLEPFMPSIRAALTEARSVKRKPR